MEKDGKSVPVGVTIAYKRHQSELKPWQRSEKTRKPKRPEKRRSSSSVQQLGRRRRKSVTLRRKAGKITKPVSSWSVFLEGAALYAACVILPALVGFLLQMYNEGFLFHVSLIYQYLLSAVCSEVENDVNTTTTFYLSGWLGWFCEYGVFLGRRVSNSVDDVRVISFDSSLQSDVWTVALCAIGLAMIRLFIVQKTVMPLKSSDQLLAMVRCKSIHLLSSDYSQTPSATPTQEKEILELEDASLASIQMPTIDIPCDSYPHDNEGQSDDEDSDGALGLELDDFEGETKEPDVSEMDINYDGREDDEDNPLSHLQDLSNRLAEIQTQKSMSPDLTTKGENRLYAGPRYATALFRLFYCTAATSLALLYFRTADFWPWYVGGFGSTAKCWDLSGGLTVSGMDADFDDRNALLKRYFLWQASYHWHSTFFHILSLLLLIAIPPSEVPGKTPSRFSQRHRYFSYLRTNTKVYGGSLAFHLLTLVMLALAYVFSSLRRMAAIGMFAFDVSSWFLHLLQVCINAPSDAQFLRFLPSVRALHNFVVIPVFFAARLGIWPALAYSVLGPESQSWLKQLEQTLWPGSASLLWSLLTVWHALVFAMSVVYARRLINLSHVRQNKKTAKHTVDR